MFRHIVTEYILAHIKVFESHKYRSLSSSQSLTDTMLKSFIVTTFKISIHSIGSYNFIRQKAVFHTTTENLYGRFRASCERPIYAKNIAIYGYTDFIS